MELVGSNVVVTANQFNPSIVNQTWLVKHRVVSEKDIEPPTIFVEGMSQIQTKQFQLVVVPPMLQFAIKPEDSQKEGELVASTVGSIVSALPHTPYAAIGLNFTWHVKPEGEAIRTLTRRLFFKDGVAPFSLFNEENSHFGAYMSKDFGMLRLKLDVKPIILKTVEMTSEDRLMFAFNFNRDLTSENAVEEILGCLSLWNAAKAESEKIVSVSLLREAR